MSQILRIILIIASILTCGYTLRKIRKAQMQIEDSLYWIVISIGLVIISVFPELVNFFSNLCGVGSPVNFVFLVMIFILLIKEFTLSLKISQLEDRIKKLVQRITIQNLENDNLIQTIVKEENGEENGQ